MPQCQCQYLNGRPIVLSVDFLFLALKKEAFCGFRTRNLQLGDSGSEILSSSPAQQLQIGPRLRESQECCASMASDFLYAPVKS